MWNNATVILLFLRLHCDIRESSFNYFRWNLHMHCFVIRSVYLAHIKLDGYSFTSHSKRESIGFVAFEFRYVIVEDFFKYSQGFVWRNFCDSINRRNRKQGNRRLIVQRWRWTHCIFCHSSCKYSGYFISASFPKPPDAVCGCVKLKANGKSILCSVMSPLSPPLVKIASHSAFGFFLLFCCVHLNFAICVLRSDV